MNKRFLCNELLERIQRGERPHIEPHWPKPFVDVMVRCWETLPQKRISFKEVLQKLEVATFSGEVEGRVMEGGEA